VGLDVRAYCLVVGKCSPQYLNETARRVLSKGEKLAWARKVGCWDILMMWVCLLEHPYPGVCQCNRTTTPSLSYLDDVLDLIRETVSGNLAWLGALDRLALVDAFQMASAI
jgi:hypothetical protein